MKTHAPSAPQSSTEEKKSPEAAQPKSASASKQADSAAKRGEPRQPDTRSDRSPKQENL
jgi:hypothetical protein